MTEPVVIRGGAAVGGFGGGQGALEAALVAPPGPGGTVTTATPEGGVSRPAYRAELGALAEVVDPRVLRRMDRFCQMAALAARHALADAGLTDPDRARTGLVLATGYGSNTTTFEFFHNCLREGDSAASPTLFSKSGHSSVQSALTIMLGLQGPSMTVCQPDLAVIPALMTARAWLLDRRADTVLVGAIDEIFDLRVYARERLFGPANDGPIRPLDLHHQSSVPGEGGFFLVLSRVGDDPDGRRPRLGQVVWGHLDRRPPRVAPSTPLVVAASGHRRCGAAYERAVPPGQPTLAFSPLIGSTPVNLLFDVLVAARIVAQRELVALPLEACARHLDAAPASPSVVTCLDCRGSGLYGEVTVEG